MKEEVIGFRAIAAADDVDVAGAAGDDQSGLGAFALDQRVDGDGRAVDQLVDRGSRQAALADAVENALRELMRRRQALGLDEFARLVVEADKVGKGAADVDGNSDHRRVPRWCGLNTPAQVERSTVTARQTIGFRAEHNIPRARTDVSADRRHMRAAYCSLPLVGRVGWGSGGGARALTGAQREESRIFA